MVQGIGHGGSIEAAAGRDARALSA
jgi:hypothetical protein